MGHQESEILQPALAWLIISFNNTYMKTHNGKKLFIPRLINHPVLPMMCLSREVTQPDMNLKKSNSCSLCLDVSINKMLLWIPDIITKARTCHAGLCAPILLLARVWPNHSYFYDI
jgi:hypothetical protein